VLRGRRGLPIGWAGRCWLEGRQNVLDRQRWASREELRLAIVTWMERAHHRKRRQRALGRLTPIEFETIQQVAPPA